MNCFTIWTKQALLCKISWISFIMHPSNPTYPTPYLPFARCLMTSTPSRMCLLNCRQNPQPTSTSQSYTLWIIMRISSICLEVQIDLTQSLLKNYISTMPKMFTVPPTTKTTSPKWWPGWGDRKPSTTSQPTSFGPRNKNQSQQIPLHWSPGRTWRTFDHLDGLFTCWATTSYNKEGSHEAHHLT